MVQYPLPLSEASLRLFNELIQSLCPQDIVSERRANKEPKRRRPELISESLLRQVAWIRYQSNQLAPINQLPVEILTHIFTYGALDDIIDQKRFPCASRAVSHVCRCWRDIALATPFLWTPYDQTLPADVLSRGGCVPRDVVLSSSLAKRELDPAFRNMRSVRFVLPRQLDVNISHFMSRPAPNLSILHITFTVPPSEGWSPGFVRIPDCPFQGQHRLEEVAIRNCDIPWDTPLFAGLRRLTIDRVSIAECMQPDHLFSILETCSALEDLDLRGCNMLAPRSADVSTRTVSLPRLRSFTFMSDKLSSDAYLGYILAPRDVSVRVRCGTYAGLDAALRIIPSSAASHNLAPPLQTSLSRCRRLVLSSPAVSGYGIDATWITCTRSHKFTVEFGHHGVELSGRLDVLADSLPLAAHLESLHIDRLAFGADTAPPLARLICGIPNLKHITFSACPFGSEDAVFDILAETAWGPSINHITLSESRSVLQSLVRSIIQSRVVGDDASQAPSKPRISLHQCGRIVAGTVEALGDVARVDWRE